MNIDTGTKSAIDPTFSCAFPQCTCNCDNNGKHQCKHPNNEKLANDRFNKGHEASPSCACRDRGPCLCRYYETLDKA